jgi:signal transduction histidine kinase
VLYIFSIMPLLEIFPPSDELTNPGRLRALYSTELLDGDDRDVFDRFTKLACALLNCPVSLVSLVDKDRQFFVSSHGFKAHPALQTGTPLSHSFCQHVVRNGEPLVVDDATKDPLLKANLAIRDLGVIAYLGVPLKSFEGHVLGSLCAIDSQARAWDATAIELLGTVATMVSDQIHFRELARELRAANLRLRDIEMERQEMVMMLVHDLRNPLTSMLGGLSLLETDPLTPNQMECLSLAEASGERVLEMVGQILDVSKAEAGRLKLNLVAADLGRLVNTAVSQLVHSAHIADVKVLTRIDPDLPTLWVDASKLLRVIINLLANAIQHSPGGNVTIQVQAGRDRETVALEIKDDGIGIPAEAHEQIFEKYHTPVSQDATRTSTGLGLAFCKKIVTAHQGQISVRSSAGKGATFSFWVRCQASSLQTAQG